MAKSSVHSPAGIVQMPARACTICPGSPAEGHKTRGDQGHLVRRERLASQSVVIRPILLEDSPCGGGPAPAQADPPAPPALPEASPEVAWAAVISSRFDQPPLRWRPASRCQPRVSPAPPERPGRTPDAPSGLCIPRNSKSGYQLIQHPGWQIDLRCREATWRQR